MGVVGRRRGAGASAGGIEPSTALGRSTRRCRRIPTRVSPTDRQDGCGCVGRRLPRRVTLRIGRGRGGIEREATRPPTRVRCADGAVGRPTRWRRRRLHRDASRCVRPDAPTALARAAQPRRRPVTLRLTSLRGGGRPRAVTAPPSAAATSRSRQEPLGRRPGHAISGDRAGLRTPSTRPSTVIRSARHAAVRHVRRGTSDPPCGFHTSTSTCRRDVVDDTSGDGSPTCTPRLFGFPPCRGRTPTSRRDAAERLATPYRR